MNPSTLSCAEPSNRPARSAAIQSSPVAILKISTALKPREDCCHLAGAAAGFAQDMRKFITSLPVWAEFAFVAVLAFGLFIFASLSYALQPARHAHYSPATF